MNSLELLTTEQAALRLGVSGGYLRKLRLVGGGPTFVKLGARVVYDPIDLAAWVEACKHAKTSEYPEAEARR